MPFGIAGRLDDWINPIVVKELRQAVQSKFVLAVLLLFLVLQVMIIGIFLAFTSASDLVDPLESIIGRRIFPVLQGLLLGTCVLFIPLYTGIRLAAERTDANVDLLFITTLRPRTIIWGKFLAALVLAVLIFSACAPFMTFTYLLRGIEVPAILFVLGIDFLAVVAAVQLAIFLAVIPGNRVWKVLVGLAGVVGLFALFSGVQSGASYVVLVGIGSALETWQFWAGTGVVLVIVLAGVGMLFAWSVALVNPPSANRLLGVRLYMLAMWLVTGAAFAVWSWAMRDIWPLRAWVILMGGGCVMVLLIAINEREQWGPRVARTIPRRGWLRLPAFFFYSGAAGGVAFAVLMFLLTWLVVGQAIKWLPTIQRQGELLLIEKERPVSIRRIQEQLRTTLRIVLMLGLYAYCYALTAVLFRRLFSRQIKPVLTWVVMLCLLAIGCTLPFLISFLMLSQDWRADSHYYWLATNPFVAAWSVPDRFSQSRNPEFYFAVAGLWAVVVTLLSLPWIGRQVQHFQPYAASVEPIPVVPVVEQPSAPATSAGESASGAEENAVAVKDERPAPGG